MYQKQAHHRLLQCLIITMSVTTAFSAHAEAQASTYHHKRALRESAKHKRKRSAHSQAADLAALRSAKNRLIAAEKADYERQQAQVGTQARQASERVVSGRGMPNVSLASPNAFGSGASVFAAGGYFTHWNGTTSPDGNFTAGASVGDAHKNVGITVSWLADSIGWNDSFNKNGGLGIRVNRYVAKNTAIAGGIATPISWGALTPMSHSYYFALTQGIDTYFPITLNIGAGTGAFYSAASMQAGRDDQIRMFGGVGLTVLKGLSLIAEDATNQINAGATYVYTIKKVSLFLTGGGMNLARQGGFKPHGQVIGGLSYALS